MDGYLLNLLCPEYVHKKLPNIFPNSIGFSALEFNLRMTLPNKFPKFFFKTPPKTNGWIPKMMGLGKGGSFWIWPFLVSMWSHFWGVKDSRKTNLLGFFGSNDTASGNPLKMAPKFPKDPENTQLPLGQKLHSQFRFGAHNLHFAHFSQHHTIILYPLVN